MINMKKKFSKLLCVSVLSSTLFAVPQAYASDASDIIDLLGQIAESSSGMEGMMETQGLPDLEAIMKSMASEVGISTDQLELSNIEWLALTKNYGMGLMETDHRFSFDPNAEYTELWSPADLDSTLQMASGGNLSRYETLKKQYADNNQTTLTTPIASINSQQLADQSYTDKAKISNATLAASEYTYDEIRRRTQNVEDLMKIADDPTKNSNEKAALDLIIRMLAEVELVQIESLRLQSLQAQVSSTSLQEEVNAKTAEKKFLSVP